MDNNRLLIIGAGGHGQVVAEAAMAMKKWSEIHFLDNRKDRDVVLDLKIIGRVSDYASFKQTHLYAFVALGNNKLRLKLIEELENAGFEVPNIIHPKAYVSQSVTLSSGIAILPGATVNTNTHIEKGCIINVNSIVDHDCRIQRAVHISSGAIVRSMVSIGEYSLIGAGSCIKSLEKVPANYFLNELEVYRNG